MAQLKSKMTTFAKILRTAAMMRVTARLAAEDMRLLHEIERQQEAAAIVDEPDPPRPQSRRKKNRNLFLVRR